MTRRAPASLLLMLLGATPLAAQDRAPKPPDAAEMRAAATITEADFRARLDVIAHDSMRGREAPSPELELTAAWVAAQFQAAGLKPGGDGDSYMQEFALRRTHTDSVTATLSGAGHSARWLQGRDFAALLALSGDLHELPVVLMAGVPGDTVHPFGDVPVRGTAVVLVVRPDQLRGSVLNPLAGHAIDEGVAVLAVAAEVPPELWQRLSQAAPDRWSLADEQSAPAGRTAVLQVRQESFAPVLVAAGEDPATLLEPEHQGIRPLPGITFSASPYETVVAEPMVANVVGVLEGSDPARRDEAVVFSSHMDHVGVLAGGRCRPSTDLPADSICNGADDNASGTVGVVELAAAFASLPSPPARTLVFAAFTAEERGLLGSSYYVAHPLVPLDRTAAVVNLDMIARNPRDTVGLVGPYYSSLGAMVDHAAQADPSLRLTPVEHTGVYQGSDHFPFAQRGVPALFFFSGEHEDLHTTADNPERADADQAARIVRLVFRVGLDVANAAGRPRWDPEARARVEGH